MMAGNSLQICTKPIKTTVVHVLYYLTPLRFFSLSCMSSKDSVNECEGKLEVTTITTTKNKEDMTEKVATGTEHNRYARSVIACTL